MSTTQETHNNYVLRKIQENKTEKEIKVIQELKKYSLDLLMNFI